MLISTLFSPSPAPRLRGRSSGQPVLGHARRAAVALVAAADAALGGAGRPALQQPAVQRARQCVAGRGTVENLNFDVTYFEEYFVTLNISIDSGPHRRSIVSGNIAKSFQAPNEASYFAGSCDWIYGTDDEFFSEDYEVSASIWVSFYPG